MSLVENLFDTSYDHADTPCSIRCNDLVVDGAYTGPSAIPDQGFSVRYQANYTNGLTNLNPVICPTISTLGYNTDSMYNFTSGIATIPSTGKWLLSYALTIANGTAYTDEIEISLYVDGVLTLLLLYLDGNPTIVTEKTKYAESLPILLDANDAVHLSFAYNIVGAGSGVITLVWSLQRIA